MIRDAETFEHLLAAVRRFVAEVAVPNEERVEADDEIPAEGVEAMRNLGTFGRSIPEAYGGSGLTSEELALAFMELTRCSVAYRVVQIFGGQGYVKGRGSERFYRDVRAFRIYEGTSQIHLLNIAKQLLKDVVGTTSNVNAFSVVESLH